MKVHIPYSRLRIFYYVTTHKSFKKAAQNLCITQGAVSQQIRDIEERLGKKLLERSSQKVELTPDGVNLFSLIAPVVEKLDNLVEEFEEMAGKIRGKIRIVSQETILLHIFPKFLSGFRKKYPDCELILESSAGKQIRLKVLSGEVDFGVCSLEGIPDGTVGRELWRFDRYFIAPLGHPLSKKKGLTLEDIAKYPVVMPAKDVRAGLPLDNLLRTHNPDLKVTVEAGGWQVVKKYVEIGFGVSVLPKVSIKPEDRTRLFLKPLSEFIGYSKYGILLKKGKRLSPAAKALIKFLSANSDFDNDILVA